MRRLLSIFSFFLAISAFAAMPDPYFQDAFTTSDVDIDLNNPIYENGILHTSEGGVIVTDTIRIQALKIRYEKVDGQATVFAEGDLSVNFKEALFIGDTLTYNLTTDQGIITNGKSAYPPWYFGGEKIFLSKDSSIIVENGFVTTSESQENEWEVLLKKVFITPDRFLTAHGIQLSFIKLPLFFIPTFRAHLDTLNDIPVRYYCRFGGEQGLRFGLSYQFLSLDNLNAFARLDYRLSKGPGFGLESYWLSEDGQKNLDMVNYIARDNSIDNTGLHVRYRLNGRYTGGFDENRFATYVQWDKLSDKDMVNDYRDKGIDLETSQRTEWFIRRQESELFVSTLTTQVRINSFQSVRQELPSIEMNFKPFRIGHTGLLFENKITGSYLDYRYAKSLDDPTDNFSTTRLEYATRMIRPFKLGAFNCTPEAFLHAIYYGAAPRKNSEMQMVKGIGCEINTSFYRYFGPFKHTLSPYTRYTYFLDPTLKPHDHYIFDENDGYTTLHTLRFGTRQTLHTFSSCHFIEPFRLDLYSYAFFTQKGFSQDIPKLFADFTLFPLETLRQTHSAAWNFHQNSIDHYNILHEWTLDAHRALSLEYRMRGRESFRKADPENFMLESFVSRKELLHSPLSDRRNTLIAHAYWRFDPKWAAEFKFRHGFHRASQPNFTEYEANLTTRILSVWSVKMSYQQRENDYRFSIHFSMSPTY